jgi:hypothetical protein
VTLPTNNPDEMLAAALELARLGLHVIPLHVPVFHDDGRVSCTCRRPGCQTGGEHENSIGKHPRIDKWGEKATADEAQIREWWRMWPDSNAGIVAGKPLPSGGFLAIIDVDPRNGGRETFEQIVEESGALPDTPHSLTGSGGDHFLVRTPEPMAKGELGKGVDFQAGLPGKHSLAVAPPSLHKSGRRYGWELSSDATEGMAIADMPAPWVERLQKKRQARAAEGIHEPGEPIVDGATGDGDGRKKKLIRDGRAMWARGHSKEEVHAALTAMNNRCDPPLDARDLERVIEFVFRVPPGRSEAYEKRARENAAPREAHATGGDAPPAPDQQPWEQFVPLEHGGAPPAWPQGVLQSVLGRFVDEVAVATQTPRDLPAMMCIAVCSAAVARKFCVRFATHREPLHTFGAVLLPPGSRKSEATKYATRPLDEYEREYNDERERTLKAMAEAKVASLGADAKSRRRKNDDDEERSRRRRSGSM